MLHQHQATSHLLEPRGPDEIAADSHAIRGNDERNARSAQQNQPFLGYDHGDVQALKGSGSATSSEYTKSSAVLWKGNPWHSLTWDLLGVVLSLCFLALGACVASLEGKPESNWSSKVVQVTRIAPSVWPILFSGILGNAVRALADWRVERGAPLLSLEQLLGSLTMASSIITIFRWSIFRTSSVVLILLWAFNPLGSQASFRGAYLRPATGASYGHIAYHVPDLTLQLMLSPHAGASSRSKPSIRALYSSTVYDYISTTQYVDPTHNATKEMIIVLGGERSAAVQAAMDNWSNVRIPSLEYHTDYNANDPQQWLATPWNQKVMNYSSLVGDRVDGVDRSTTGNTSFTTSSSYQKYDCSPWFQLNASSPTGNNIPTKSSEADSWLVKHTGQNYTSHIMTRNSKRLVPRTFFIGYIFANMTSSPDTPEIVFASRGYDHTRLHMTTCTARTTYVDTNITCISRGSLGKATCGVDAIRQMPQPPSSPTLSVLNNYTHAVNSFGDFTDMLDDIQVGSGQSSITEYYLADPLKAFVELDAQRNYTDLGDLDIATFERRFALLWNTMWKIGWLRTSVMGGKLEAPRELVGGVRVETVMNTTARVVVPLPPVYAIDRAWLAIYFVSVGVMLAAAVFSLVVRAMCRAPVLLGHVSSLMRDSVYFEDCGIYTSSVEDAVEKSRRLGGMRVMVGDVGGGSGKEGSGKIAFVPPDMGRRVERGRWYD